MTGPAPIPVWMDPLKPTLLSSNSVLLEGSDRFVIVDAGGEPARLGRLLDEIRRRQSAGPRPVCFVQTHAHIDHIAGLTELTGRTDGWPCEIAAHAHGLRVLHEADRRYSLAELSGRPQTPFRPDGWRQWVVMPAGRGGTEPDFRLPLGGGRDLEAFCTPGHSPDGVIWRAGPELFVGDLLAATAPLVAGIAGWDREALLASLDRLEQILQAGGIRRVHVGHGRPLDLAAATTALFRARCEAGELAVVEPVDLRRVNRLAAGAQALITELEELFAEVARRIGALADKLAQIQESRTADEVRAIDRSQEVQELLDAFGAFRDAAGTAGGGTLGVAAKGVQTALRVLELLNWDRLDWVLDEALLRYARTRVVDFIQRAKGLSLEVEAVAMDLGERVRMFAKRLRDQQIGACRLDGVPGGEAGFRRQLVACLARTPSLGVAVLKPSVAPGLPPVRLDATRFFDALTRVIECQVERGATRFDLRAERRADEVILSLQVEGVSWAFDSGRTAVWEKVFARAGARVEIPSAGSVLPLVFAFDP